MPKTARMMLARLRAIVNWRSPRGTRGQVSDAVPTPHGRHQIAAATRIRHDGRIAEQYWFEGTRVSKDDLICLTCEEGHCLRGQALWARWREFQALRGRPWTGPVGRLHGTPGRSTRPPLRARSKAANCGNCQAQPMDMEPLMKEVPILVNGLMTGYVARPARFPCHTKCRQNLQGPMEIVKQGYDLFEGERYVAGGVVHDEQYQHPRLPDLAAVHLLVMKVAWETRAALAAATGRPLLPPDLAADPAPDPAPGSPPDNGLQR